MTDGVLATHNLIVPMDYGQFVIRGCWEPVDSIPLGELLSSARSGGHGVDSDGSAVLVMSPHHHNFAMELSVEVWDRGPADDLDSWGDVFEAGVEVGSRGELGVESPTCMPVTCAVPPGHYRVRICGRGFVANGCSGSLPGDTWRVQLWPGDSDTPARRLRSWDGSPIPPVPAARQRANPADAERLRVGLAERTPGKDCCRRAEAATLLCLLPDTAADWPLDAAAGLVVKRIITLMDGRTDQAALRVDLGLIDNRGRTVRGLPMVSLRADRCCVAAAWCGAYVAGGDLAGGAGRERVTVRCPNPESAMSLIGLGRRLGVSPLNRESPDGLHRDVVVDHGIAFLAEIARLSGPTVDGHDG